MNFPVPQNDLTVQILTELFGSGWWSYLNPNAQAPNGGPATVLFALMGSLNAIALTAASLMAAYVLVIGIAASAYDGKPLGARFHTLWAPVRFSVALGLLTPLPGLGLSALQAVILFAIYTGIGGADWMAGKAYDYLGGQPLSLNAPQATAVPSLEKDLYRVALAEAWVEHDSTYQWQVQSPGASTEYFVDDADSGAETITNGALDMSTPAVHGVSGVMHVTFPPPTPTSHSTITVPASVRYLADVSIPCPLGQSSSVCVNRAIAVTQMYSQLLKAARYVVAGQAQDPNVASSLADAMRQYLTYDNQGIAGSFADFTSATGADSSASLTSNFNKYGWALLGAWYWNLSSMSRDVASLSGAGGGAEPTADLAGLKDFLDNDVGPGPSLYVNNATLVTNQVNVSVAPVVASDPEQIVGEMQLGDSGEGNEHWYQKIVNYVSIGITHRIIKWMNGSDGDALAGASNFGDGILDVVGATLTAYIILGSATEGADRASSGVWGQVANLFTGDATSGLTGAARGAFEAAGPFVVAGILALISFGMMLAVYLPAVPFLVWTMGIIGWLILCIEAVVAAPMWAAAHAIPEGEGMAGQHARQGYILILTMVMRPSLMVVGFFASFALMHIIGNFIDVALQVFIHGFATTKTMGLFVTLGLCGLIAGAMVATIHKVFSLITFIPENVSRWAVGQSQSLGEQEHAGHTQGAVIGTAAAGGMLQRAHQTASENRQSKAARAQAATKEKQDEARHQQLVKALSGRGGETGNSGNT